MRRAAIALFLTLAGPSLALAENCRSAGRPLPQLTPGTVAENKVYFTKGSCGRDPYAKGCQTKTYLVRGDRVFIDDTVENGSLLCVGYLGRGGSYVEGWLPARQIVQGE